MNHVSPLTYGAQYHKTGTDFRFWAPGARQVALELLQEDRVIAEIAMMRGPKGVHEARACAPPGTAYRYRLNGSLAVPDPASRAQAADAGGPSLVIDPASYQWRDPPWPGRPWSEAVLYELHLGTFTEHAPGQALAAAARRLPELAELGITGITLMPVADFPGRWNWGYDGVLPYAVDRAYGGPDDLKRFVDQAHQHRLMVLLDVVYHHFGPQDCFLRDYAPSVFRLGEPTPWGDALVFDRGDHFLRTLFLENALYWLEEFQMDGLRLDAPQYIQDHSTPHFLEELGARVQDGPGRHRAIHLILEQDAPRPSSPLPPGFAARWYDPFHHAAHVLLTGEICGYYAPYSDEPVPQLVATLVHSGPPATAIAFLQNHDQVGNRPWGDRAASAAPVERLRALLAVVLLAPLRPLLFMGEETHSDRPFPFFCDFARPLAQAVTEGRRREFAAFPEFGGAMAPPDAAETFERARPASRIAPNTPWPIYYRELLALRQRWVTPLLQDASAAQGVRWHGETAFQLYFSLTGGARLHLYAQLGPSQSTVPGVARGTLVYASSAVERDRVAGTAVLPGWTVLWILESGETA